MRKHFTQTNRERVDARVLRKQVSQKGDIIVYKTERIATGTQFEQPCIMIKWSTPPWSILGGRIRRADVCKRSRLYVDSLTTDLREAEQSGKTDNL